MREDISNKTVVILLILTILIAVSGTLLVLDKAEQVKSGQSSERLTAQSYPIGTVKVSVTSPPAQGNPADPRGSQ
ncbi:MAG TPA: hypothetical protein VJI75_01585 [Candidatus Nanoarchaeia archaeon]|nr:hypothetical protein [Candidatus Nanoarchaeia archaeon]